MRGPFNSDSVYLGHISQVERSLCLVKYKSGKAREYLKVACYVLAADWLKPTNMASARVDRDSSMLSASR